METLPLDGAEGRRLSLTDAQQYSTISELQKNSNDVDMKLDLLARVWEATATAAEISWECLKSRAIIPLLRWALSALGAPPVHSTDVAGEIFLKLELMNLESSLAVEKKEHENMRLRCLRVERSLNEEKEKRENMKFSSSEHEKTRLRCVQLERSLDEANEKQTQLQRSVDAAMEKAEKMKVRCKQLEERLAMMQTVISKAEKIVGVSKDGDEKLLREIEVLRAQGLVR